MKTIREDVSEATGREAKIVTFDNSPDPEQARDSAVGAGDAAESTKSSSDYSRESPHSSGLSNIRVALLDRTLVFTLLIALFGVGVSVAFLGLGVKGAESDKRLQFERQASEIINAIETSWHDFEVAGLWVHEACRSSADQKDTHLARGICSRKDFFGLYEYLLSSGLEFEAVAWVPNVTHVDRASMEEESRTCKCRMRRMGRGEVTCYRQRLTLLT
jgi:hypothetical protein